MKSWKEQVEAVQNDIGVATGMNSTSAYDYLVKLLVIGDSGEKLKGTHPVGLLGDRGLSYFPPCLQLAAYWLS